MADPITIAINPSTGTCLRSGSTTVTSGWFSKWQGTEAPQVTIAAVDGSNTNNITVATDGLTLAEGSATSYSYAVSVPVGYIIKGMTASIVNAEGTPVVDFAGKSVSTSAVAQKVVATDINTRSATIALTSTSSNAKATFTAWTVTVDEGVGDTLSHITYSTDTDKHWYYIVNAGTTSYCAGKVWMYDGAADRMRWGDKAFTSNRIWSFWQGSNGKLAIMDYDGNYVGTAGVTNGSTSQFGKSTSANYSYTVSYYNEGQFTISDGGVELHAQQSGNVIVRWPVGENNASLWNFEEVDVSNPETTLGTTAVVQGKVTTGIGNKNVPIIRSTLLVQGLTEEADFQGVTGKIVATDLKDVVGVKAYFASNSQELYVDPDKSMTWRTPNGELYADGTISEDGTYTITGSRLLTSGTYYLWIALDVADEAKEGNIVDATITSYVVSGKDIAEVSGDPEFEATIFLSEGSVLMPMDNGSLYYRIPAITCTARGNRLVTLTDDRLDHNGDLPSHVYLVAQHSDDNGKTWSEPVRVAGTAETGGDYGHGDASLVTNRINGDLVAIMTCATNGNGFWASTPDAPQTWKVMMSHDDGLTWTVPVDHTKELYGTGSPNPNWWGGFSGSGAALQKRDGTLVSPFVNRERDADGNESRNFYFFMSKDGGKTWYVSGTSGTTGCDEPKTLERNNGDLAISVRTTGYNFYNVSTDDGMTWKNPSQTHFTTGITGNACDGDYMVWCSTLDGNAQNIALQTKPFNGSRKNVSIALSEDEGETFFSTKTICPRGSAYSSTVVLPDGTLGVYYEEEGVYGGYTMRFVRFSLDWASDGKYKFDSEHPFHPIQSNISYEMPAYEWNTIVLPYEAVLPDGVKAYDCTETIFRFSENDTEYTGILLNEVKGTTLEAQTPYVVNGPEGIYTFGREVTDWKAQDMKDNCLYKNGPLIGQFVNKRIKGDGQTIYNNFKNIASRGGVGFNRVTSGSVVTIPAYNCNLQLSTTSPSELTMRPQTSLPVKVQDIIYHNGEPEPIYTLQGIRRKAGETGIFVMDGKKILIN